MERREWKRCSSENSVIVVKQKTAYEMLRSVVGSEMSMRDRAWTGTWTFAWPCGWTCDGIDGLRDGWMDGWMDGWIYGLMD